jgi:uncharacterized protein
MARTRLKWFKMRKKTEPELPYEPPIWMGPISNGEFYRPVTKRDVQIREEILRRADDYSRRVGMDRREFLATSMGMATTLSVFNLASGCGNDGLHKTNPAGDFATAPSSPATGTSAGAAAAMNGAGGRGASAPLAPTGPGPNMSSNPAPVQPTPGTGGMGGTATGGMAGDGGFMVSPDMCMNVEMADRLFKKDYFIIDMQTHHLGNRSMSFGMMEGCGTAGSTENDYIRSIFMESDTTVAILSGLPSEIGANGDLTGGFSNMDMVTSRDRINKGFAPGADRMIAHCQTNPYDGPDRNGPMMEKFLTMYKTRGWKCYPPVGNGSTGWFLTDDVAISFIQKAVELGEPLICAHKGFPLSQSWSRMHANPIPDVGKIAMMFPEVNFVIYHSACDSMHPEAEYNPDPDPNNGGADRLAKVVSEAGLTGKNVYAEMGSAWYLNMRDVAQATHYIGKMLKYVGEERLVWGSECCWFASPQCQIEAMKAFKMDSAIRDMNQYPDLTDDLKRKLFGLNGTKLYNVDPNACRYQLDRTMVAMEKQRRDEELGPRRWVMNNRPAITSWREWLALDRKRKATGEATGNYT